MVYYEIDGRQSGYSGGLTMTQLAQEMIDRGCVTVVNFDGGGSSAVAAKQMCIRDSFSDISHSVKKGTYRRSAGSLLDFVTVHLFSSFLL